MHEPPSGIAPAAIEAALRSAYGLEVAELTFLPIGYDSSAWVYQARTAAGADYFLKLRAGGVNEAGLVVPHYLHAHGLAHVVAPLPTRDQALWAPLGPFALILYPFVRGGGGIAEPLSDGQWRAYGALLRRVHTTPVEPGLARLMPREAFAPPGADLIRRLDAALAGPAGPDPTARALAELWAERRAEILLLVERAEGLGSALAGRDLPHVICHADIHTGNLLRGDDGGVWFVDWDTTTLAPRERDLMFVIGGISASLVGPREEALFAEGYGPAEADPQALAYYRYAWAVSDIADFADQVLSRPDLGEHSRRVAFTTLAGLFRPGEIVSIALGSPRG